MSCSNTMLVITNEEQCNMINDCDRQTLAETAVSIDKVDNLIDNTSNKDISCVKIQRKNVQHCNVEQSTLKSNTKESEMKSDENASVDDSPPEEINKLQIKSHSENQMSSDKVQIEPNMNENHKVECSDNDVGKTTVSKGLIEDIEKLDISENNAENNRTSTVVLNKQSDSLRKLLLYDTSDEESDDSDFENNWQLHLLNNPDVENSVDSESDSNDLIESSNDERDASNKEEGCNSNNKKIFYPKSSELNSSKRKPESALYSLEELDRFQLPPTPDISNLKIDYENEEFLHIGQVKAIMESLVTVEAIEGIPSYDLDTILFIDDQTSKKPLGAIYDVIGPVVSPIYCIRLGSEQEIQEKGVKLNMKVYSAPKSKHTQYVFVAELMKIKGTDASWLDDKELPVGVGDSSGDESEAGPEPQVLKRKRDSLERHQRFEKSMNRCNSLHTRVAKLIDHHKLTRKGGPFNKAPLITSVAGVPDVIPAFNPAVPPPPIVDLRNMVSPAAATSATPEQFHNFQDPHFPRAQQHWQQRHERHLRGLPQSPHVRQPHHYQNPNYTQAPNYHQNHNQNPNNHQNQNWNHHPGPSRSHGPYYHY